MSQGFLNRRATKTLRRQKLQETLREIFALTSVFSCSRKINKRMREFLRSKVRERKSDLYKKLQ